MPRLRNLLIVYTDEVGSTRRDLNRYKASSICAPRIKLFRRQLEAISRLQDGNWKVLKSVGDSLVLSYKIGDAANAVTALFDAWRTLTTSNGGRSRKAMRVAIHKPFTERWANGTLIKRTLLRAFGKPHLMGVWKTYDSLDDDLFGMEMNLAARLANLPSDAAFIVGENVLDKPGARQTVILHLARYGYCLGPRTPVTCLKGFSDYLGMNYVCLTGNAKAAELWCMEVLQKARNDGHRPLLLDSRQFPAWRAIVAKAEIQNLQGRRVFESMTSVAG